MSKYVGYPVDPRQIDVIHFIKGDITKVQSGLVCHGVNCQGVMGAGVAKAIRTKWPAAYTSYKKYVNMNKPGAHNLGQVDLVEVGVNLVVANCFTQDGYGNDGKAYADRKAIEKSLEKAFTFANANQLSVYIPHIGGGLGGLNFYQDVLPDVYWLAANYAVHVNVIEF